MLTRPGPLHVIKGEPFEHLVTMRVKATGDPLDPWPDTIRAAMGRGTAEQTITVTDDADAGTALLSLTADQTGALVGGLWTGGLEVDGRTWLRFKVIVEEDPTP